MIIHGDCREQLASFKPSSVHMVLTDPPYFLDGLDGEWRKGKPPPANGSVGGLPIGMKFDRRQGARLRAFMAPIAKELFRALKPGGFALAFTAPRLAFQMAAAFDNAGFEIRDQIAWRFTKRAQMKAMGMQHFLRRRGIEDASFDGRKTPQLKPEHEPIVVAMKPVDGGFVDNWIAHRTGLIDATQRIGGGAPSNVITIEKEPRNGHLTPKPIALLEHLIRLFTAPGAIVVDPFLGSGSTHLAATRTGRDCIGIEVDAEYAAIARRRCQ